VAQPDAALVCIQRVAELGRAGEAQAAQLRELETKLGKVQEKAQTLAARLDCAVKLHTNLQSRCACAAALAPSGVPANALCSLGCLLCRTLHGTQIHGHGRTCIVRQTLESLQRHT
jgi:hypothetical protein